MIIKLRDNVFVKVESIVPRGVWGWRWIRNENRFSDQCIFYPFYEEVKEDELPKALPRLEIDK